MKFGRDQQKRKRYQDGRYAPEVPSTVNADGSKSDRAADAMNSATSNVRLPAELLEFDSPQEAIEAGLRRVPGLKEARSDLAVLPASGQAQIDAARSLHAQGHSPQAAILAALVGPPQFA